MAEIPLTQGQVALVDEADVALLMDGPSWYASWDATVHGFYAVRHAPRTRRLQRMHAFLTGYARTDHINHDTLDNRRSNLRAVNAAQSAQNRRGNRRSTSMYRGVSWRSSRGHWVAQIQVEGRNKDAARLYDEAARLHFGEFAFLNMP